ncbi:uncharacterized protein LOC124310803 isoform X1 [Daphnia pulicaria]|uniref:uncharacterized protein LOC124310803 isoform X1 n=1 Tax=Daphnia pulicaria TaxID=35523 RepID=UPI001EEB5687|nr:uncharacterized protein LOC124310803 isoform X1 [Daphnia pulicaria]
MFIYSYRPLHFLVLAVTVPLSIYYFVLMMSDVNGRLQRRMEAISPRELELFERSLKFDEKRKPGEGDNEVTGPTTISWDDLVDEAMLKPILDLDGPKKWLRLQATGLMSSERKLEKRSINEVEKIHSSGTAATFNLMDEDYKSNLHPISYNCTVEYVNEKRLQQDHPCVIDVIQRLYLHQPHKMDRLDATYVASNKESIQTNSILRILNNQVQSDGFFVDYRGSDSGEFHSDTFYMEKTLRWQGLLIDGSRQSHRKLPAGNRQVDSLPICLSPEPFPVQVTFNSTNQSKVITTQCFPLYSVLLAVNRTKIDLIRLSAEGIELKVLQTVPWDKVNVTILSVEWNHHVPVGEAAAINRYMKRCGFTKFRQISAVNNRIKNSKINNYINTNFFKSVHHLQSL